MNSPAFGALRENGTPQIIARRRLFSQQPTQSDYDFENSSSDRLEDDGAAFRERVIGLESRVKT